MTVTYTKTVAKCGECPHFSRYVHIFAPMARHKTLRHHCAATNKDVEASDSPPGWCPLRRPLGENEQ